MNSTVWQTLSAFVLYMGRSGKATIEKHQVRKDWWIQYIDRDPAVIKRQQLVKSTLRREAKDRERSERRYEESRKRLVASAKPEPEKEKQELERKDGETISFGLSKKRKTNLSQVNKAGNVFMKKNENENENSRLTVGQKRKASNMSGLMQELESQKRLKRVKEVKKMSFGNPKKALQATKWLRKGIILKVKHKKFKEGKYHKQKGEVVGRDGTRSAVLKMLKKGHKIAMDQRFLEPVTPSNGRDVMILFGEHVGKQGTLIKVDTKTFLGTVKLIHERGLIEKIRLPFEWFSKTASIS